MVRVFSQKYFSTFLGNVGIYSVGIESVYQIGQSGKTRCFASVLREVLTHELLMKHNCLHPVLTLCIPVMCKAHASFRGMLSRKLLVKTLHFSICLSLHTHSLSLTTLTNKSHMKYRVHSIEHNYNQIWHRIKANKTHSCNYNFTEGISS